MRFCLQITAMICTAGLFFILHCSAVALTQLSPAPPTSRPSSGQLGCGAALLHPACRWGLKTAFWRHSYGECCSSLPEGNYSSLASQALPPPRPAFLEEGSAVFKEQQFFPLSWLPRSSAEKQKEAEGPALEIIYQCKTLWEIFSNMCNCIRIYTHAHIRI